MRGASRGVLEWSGPEDRAEIRPKKSSGGRTGRKPQRLVRRLLLRLAIASTGALRVTVRPDYEGLPPEGWTWQGERDERPALEALTKPARVAEVTVPERKIAARERREA